MQARSLAGAPLGPHTRSMEAKKAKNPYAMTLAELERQTHVPFENQVTEQEGVRPGNSGNNWDELQRLMLLAGGA